jgi:hypothetical protein
VRGLVTPKSGGGTGIEIVRDGVSRHTMLCAVIGSLPNPTVPACLELNARLGSIASLPVEVVAFRKAHLGDMSRFLPSHAIQVTRRPQLSC